MVCKMEEVQNEEVYIDDNGRGIYYRARSMWQSRRETKTTERPNNICQLLPNAIPGIANSW